VTPWFAAILAGRIHAVTKCELGRRALTPSAAGIGESNAPPGQASERGSTPACPHLLSFVFLPLPAHTCWAKGQM
jgi:hypothetical protein